MRFMTVEGKLNGEKFVDFLRRLLHNGQRPIFLIVMAIRLTGRPQSNASWRPAKVACGSSICLPIRPS